ncbi:MAG: cyclic nucleotide-binding domain-containing protein [Planctomycetia bacterium]|nr:cyclic nucleotide-binding domain-containing protein [Planctomycetia bacterium]
MTTTSRATISAKPAAELAPRAGDEILRSDELQQFELFANLKKPVSVEKFPGSIVLRRFRKGTVICRQGERGHSAFYIVRSDDMHKLRNFRERRGGETAAAAKTPDAPAATDAAARQVATAYILTGQAKASSGFLSKLFTRKPRGAEHVRPQFIPNDGPTDVDYATRQAPMREGDVFGEMSCMTLAPRSATVVVDEDCYMIEFLRNIFDQMQRDAGYRQKTDEQYAERVLSTHLRRLELFQDLTDAQIEILRQASHLEVVDPGAVICDEGDQSDSVYLIRSGVVQVVRGAHVVFRTNDVADWPKFCRALLPADSSPSDEKKEAAAESPKTKVPASSGAQDILAAARAAMKSKATGAQKQLPAEKPVKPHAAQPSASVADIMAAAQKPPVAPPSPPATALDSPSDGESTALILASAPKPSGDSKLCVWSWFAPRIQSSIRSIARGEEAVVRVGSSAGRRAGISRAVWRSIVQGNDEEKSAGYSGLPLARRLLRRDSGCAERAATSDMHRLRSPGRRLEPKARTCRVGSDRRLGVPEVTGRFSVTASLRRQAGFAALCRYRGQRLATSRRDGLVFDAFGRVSR